MGDKKTEVMVEVPAKEEKVSLSESSVSVEEGTAAGLDPREVTLGKSSGVLTEKAPEKKEPEKKETVEGEEAETTEGAEGEEGAEKKEPEKKEPEKKEPTEAEREAEETAAMQDPAKEQALIKKYNPNEKALYFKHKKERLKRQAAERENSFLKTQNEALRRKALKEVDPNADLKKDLEGLDGEEAAEIDPEKPLTKADLDRIEKEKKDKADKASADARVIKERLDVLNSEAKSKYEDFDEVMDLANEVMRQDKHGVYAMKLVALAADPDGNPAEYAYTLGKLHPNYGKHRKEKQPNPAAGGDPKKVEKIVENAEKRQSSAALGGGTQKGRLVSEDDLTVEDVAGMSQSAWDKLSEKTRNRLMRS